MSSTRTEILFIENNVTDYQTLLAAVQPGVEVHLLDANQNGLLQMAQTLTGRNGIDAIHLISHGAPGTLNLGTLALNSQNMPQHSIALATIGEALAPGTDILLYGCNVAQGDVGLQFITSLAQGTGAEVAGSSNATGEAAMGGDWVLEQATGRVETSSLLGNRLAGLLAVNTAPTFVVNAGKLTTDFFGSNDQGHSITLQPDGKILVAGQAQGSSGGFALARYNANGSLDTSFDADGKLTTEVGNSIILQTDGKILVAGYSENDFALARYNANGSLDTSFDTDGKLTTDFFGSNDQVNSITVQTDGKILVAGTAGNSSGSSSDFALARYNVNGSLDTCFDTDGKLTTDFGWRDYGNSITLQADGKILVAGSARNSTDFSSDFALARYNANGSLDTSFDTDGKLTTDFFGSLDEGNGITLQADGKILVAGYAYNSGITNAGFALARYNANGSLDTALTTDFFRKDDYGNSITLQPDGKILVAGSARNSSGSSTDFALARYANGSLDTSFDTDGKLTTDFFGSNDQVNSITVQTDGKILVAGTAGNSSGSSDFALARYNANGSLDTTFGDVVVQLDGNPTYSGSSPVVLDADVQISDAELQSANNFSGATLTLARHAGADINDVFSARAGSALSALTSGSFFSVSGVTIGRVVNNSNGSLQLGFNSNATQALVSTAMQQIAYANTATIPPAQAQIDWTFSDGNTGAQGSGGALAATGSTVVNITARNVAPVLANALADISLLPNTSLNYILPTTAFFDANAGDTLIFSISMNDGTALPTWLAFDPATRTFSGNPGTPGPFDLHVFDIKVTAKDLAGATVSDVFALTVGTTISGSATQGQTLTAGKDLVSTENVSYQWLSNGQSISGETGNTLVLGQTQVGKTITVTATYSINGGTPASVTSVATVAVANVNDSPVGAVTIAGVPTQGQTLTASNTLADLDGMGVVSYQWKAGGVAITGATNNSLTLTQAQVGKTISVTASYTDGYGAIESVASSASTTVANVNDLPTGEATITGTPTQGQTLTASNTLADLDGMGVVAYQWKADGVVIAGATNNTLTLTQAQVGKTISVTASYTDGYGAIESVASSASTTVANVNDLPTGEVTIIGTPTHGQTLTASNTLADLDGMGVVSYQWKAGGVAITGATSGTFTLTSDEVGKTITVEARYTDGFGTAEGKTSSATATVASSDTTPPTATAFSPVDEASEVAVGSNIVVTFSEPISRGTGNIVLKTAAGVTVATYDAATSANIDISGKTLTINPSSDLAKDTGYTVEFAAGSVKDTVGNPYAGTSSYNFTTVAGTASVITLSPATTSITEGDTGSQSLNFTVTLSVASTSTVTVNYATANGTATAGSDYTATSGTLSFAAGETSKTITVSVLGDKTVESNENFTLVLSSPSGATLGSAASATVTIIDNDSTTVLPSFTVPGTLGNDFFIPSGGNNYLGGGGSDTYIISPYTLSGAVTAKITDTEGANVIQLVDGLTIASSSFYGNAAQLTLSNGASVQILGTAAFTYLVGANTPAGDTASSQTYAQFAATLGASVPTSSTPVNGTTNFQVPSVITPASAPVPATASTAATVPGTLGNDFFLPSGGNSYLGGGGSDTYIISPYALSGAVTAKITDTEGSNVIQLVDGLTIASSSFYGNAVQLTLSNGANVQILGAAAFGYQVGANAPAGDTASSQTYAQFAATLGASVPTGSTPVSGTTNFVVPAASGAAIQMLEEASVTLVGISDMDVGLVQ